VYAVGRVTSTAYRAEQANEFGEWKVDVAFEATVEPPLLRVGEIGADPILSSFGPFMGRMVTNFPVSSWVATRLEEVLRPRLVSVDPTKAGSRFDPAAYELDRAFEHARQEVKDELLAHLRSLTAGEFEHVVRLLLDALDYEDVRVVGKSGDQGIDVRAVLRYRGVADVPTSVQAKKFGAGNNVDGAVIGRLRGSLPVEAHGIVVTTSDFTKQARVEATEPGLKPIALVNGDQLVELLIDLGIGVEKRQVEIVRLAPEKLSADLVL
jgi:restriction endonuclease Mrr